MKKQEKADIVARWQKRFQSATAAVVVQYQGMTAGEMAGLRRQCREAGLTLGIVRNTLARRAMADLPFAALGKGFKGPLAIAVTGDADQTKIAKLLTKVAKENEKIKIWGGALGAQLMDKAGVERLATLSGMNELRGQFLALLQAAPTKFVRTLNEIPSGLVRVLDARRRQLEGAPA